VLATHGGIFPFHQLAFFLQILLMGVMKCALNKGEGKMLKDMNFDLIQTISIISSSLYRYGMR